MSLKGAGLDGSGSEEDSVVYPPTGSTAIERKMSTLPMHQMRHTLVCLLIV